MAPVKKVEFLTKVLELDKVYSMKHLTRKLEKVYGKDIVISKPDGKRSIVCFSNVADYIIDKSLKDIENTEAVRTWMNHPNSNKIDQKRHQNSSICIQLLPIEVLYQEL